MLKTTQYSERYFRYLWEKKQISFAELSHCYPCCMVATKKECLRCRLNPDCKLFGQVEPSKIINRDGTRFALASRINNYGWDFAEKKLTGFWDILAEYFTA
jgi:hypothetical protein